MFIDRPFDFDHLLPPAIIASHWCLIRSFISPSLCFPYCFGFVIVRNAEKLTRRRDEKDWQLLFVFPTDSKILQYFSGTGTLGANTATQNTAKSKAIKTLSRLRLQWGL
jgi:hypothetical protein